MTVTKLLDYLERKAQEDPKYIPIYERHRQFREQNLFRTLMKPYVRNR